LRQHVVFQRRDFLAQKRKGAKRCRVSKGFFFRPLRLCAFASATLRPCDFATLRLCAFAPLREKSSPHETLCANLRTLETRHQQAVEKVIFVNRFNISGQYSRPFARRWATRLRVNDYAEIVHIQD
jgi:hypothetical protein